MLHEKSFLEKQVLDRRLALDFKFKHVWPYI